jgi:hypothetical protein
MRDCFFYLTVLDGDELIVLFFSTDSVAIAITGAALKAVVLAQQYRQVSDQSVVFSWGWIIPNPLIYSRVK